MAIMITTAEKRSEKENFVVRERLGVWRKCAEMFVVCGVRREMLNR